VPVEISTLTRQLEPTRTVLLFGAGSSIPSGAPSVASLQDHFEKIFGIPASGYSLAEQTGIIEARTRDRAKLISELRSQFTKLRPAGAVLNLPLYKWKSIYTTNYDELIEECYRRKEASCSVYTTNFDFGLRDDPDSVQLFKLHGTLTRDEAFGDRSRMILTQGDYDLTEQYREQLYDRLKSDLAGAHLIIIGHSLADHDIRAMVDRAVRLKISSGAQTRITLLMYTRDEGRATLYESRGLDVCFGGLDDFFGGMVQHIVGATVLATGTSDPLDAVPALRTSTIDVAHSLNLTPDPKSMYNGWPATYADIRTGLTFQRDIARDIQRQFTAPGGKTIAILLGASGVGKTSAARQALAALSDMHLCWEHKSDRPLMPNKWQEVATILKKTEKSGILLIDNAHDDLGEANELAELLKEDNNSALKLILVSTNHQWNTRVKASSIHKDSKQFYLSIVGTTEIDRLITLVDTRAEFRPLISNNFFGYSRDEKRRRLIQTCSADMFVCLKNIFSSERLDDILLREFADLDTGSQEIYSAVAAMESAGVHVHRQLVIRLLGIRADIIGATLSKLEDIIHEEAVNEREGIYAWHGRHRVIMQIIAEHTYYDKRRKLDLFNTIVDAIRPSYDIEIRTLRALCNVETGLATIGDRKQQNDLLRKMISIAPGERVPRHRLLRNLIEMGEYPDADAELRIFQKDFKMDGPAMRYAIVLATARAVRSPGLMREHRIALLEKAREIAAAGADRFSRSRGVLTAYCETGIEIAKLTGRREVFDLAIEKLKEGEEKIGDPKITQDIRTFMRRMADIATEPAEYIEADLEDEDE
jgi:hypothetical protein